MGALIQFYMYGWEIKHSVAMLMITYGSMMIFRREQQHIIIFVVLYLYQSIIHLDLMFNRWGIWGADITAFTMNLVCRLISLGMCYRDGSNRCKGDSNNEMALEKMPSFYKVAVYTFNLTSCIASPFYEYKDFEEWMELKGRYKTIPSTWYAGCKRFGLGATYIITMAVVGSGFDVEYLWSEEFCGQRWYVQMFNQYFICIGIGMTYFIVWCFVDAASTFSGLNYNGTDPKSGRIQWDRYQN